MNHNTTAGSQGYFGHKEDTDNRWWFAHESGSGMQFEIRTGGTIIIDSGWVAGAEISANAWYHIAIVKNGNDYNMYVDGVSKWSTTDSDTATISAALIIGYLDAGSTYPLNANMDEIRLSNVARYTANFTPPTTEFTSDANTLLLIHSNTTMGSTTFADSSSNNHTVTANGDVMNVAPKIGTGMAAFDGSGDSLQYATSSAWNNGTGAYTVESWIQTKSQASQFIWYGAATTWTGLRVRVQTDGFINANEQVGGTDHQFIGTTAVDDGNWHHWAVSREAGGVAKLYVDGILDATQDANYNVDNTNSYFIGIKEGGNEPYDGYIDEFRVSKIARYTGTFTPSTTAFKDDKDTVLLLHMDGGGGIDPVTNLPTLTGQGTYFWDASTNAIFYGADGIATNKSLINGDGSSYLTVPSSSDWAFGTSSDFTIECWIYFTDKDTSRDFVNVGNSTDLWRFHREGGNTISWNHSGSSAELTSASTVGMGQWYHIAVARASGTMRLFINGIEEDSAADTFNYLGEKLWINAGYNGYKPVNGYTDQYRISNNARYTSAFTPPTTPFTADANTKLLVQSNWSEGGLGADHSNNYNYFTPTNLTADDMMLDSPMNNFCTMNPLTKRVSTLSEGNLKHTTSHSSAVATFGSSTGKWYWEQTWSGGKNEATIGFALDGADIFDTSKTTGSSVQGTNYVTLYVYDGKIYNEGSAGSALTTFAGNDILGWAVDADAGDVYLYRNGTVLNSGTAVVSGKTGRTWFPMGQFTTGDVTQINYNFGTDSSFAGKVTSQGNQDENNKGDFYYAPPAGFLALCTDNLSDPSIALPKEHYNAIQYAGNGGGSTDAITGVGFKPDLNWIKARNAGELSLYN